MKKLLMLNLILIIAALLGSLYGIVHDQITYTILLNITQSLNSTSLV